MVYERAVPCNENRKRACRKISGQYHNKNSSNKPLKLGVFLWVVIGIGGALVMMLWFKGQSVKGIGGRVFECAYLPAIVYMVQYSHTEASSLNLARGY